MYSARRSEKSHGELAQSCFVDLGQVGHSRSPPALARTGHCRAVAVGRYARRERRSGCIRFKGLMATQPAPQNLDPGALLEAAPEEEFALIELRLDWPPDLDIYPEHMQLWLRCFVITADPLGWIPDRGEAWTAVTVEDDVLEVDLYLTVSAVRAAMEECGGDMAAAVGRYAGTVMAAALAREEELIAGDYPRLRRARRDAAPARRPRRRPRRVLAPRDPGPAQLERGRPRRPHRPRPARLRRRRPRSLERRPRARRARHRGVPGVQGPGVRLPVEPRGRQGVAVRAAQGGREDRQHRAHRPRAAVEPRGLARDRQGRHAHQQAARADLRPAAAARRRRRRPPATTRASAAAARSTSNATAHERRRPAHRRLPVRRRALRARRAAGGRGLLPLHALPAPHRHGGVGAGVRRRRARCASCRARSSCAGWRHPDGGMEKCFCGVCGAHLGSRDPDSRSRGGRADVGLRRRSRRAPEPPGVRRLRRAVGADPRRRPRALRGGARLTVGRGVSNTSRPARGSDTPLRRRRAGSSTAAGRSSPPPPAPSTRTTHRSNGEAELGLAARVVQLGHDAAPAGTVRTPSGSSPAGGSPSPPVASRSACARSACSWRCSAR